MLLTLRFEMIQEEVLHVKCKQVGTNDGLSVYEYKPSLINTFAVSLDSLSLDGSLFTT